MKKLFDILLKVAAPLFFVLALGMNAKAESPNWTYVGQVNNADNSKLGLITSIISEQNNVRIAGDFASFTKANNTTITTPGHFLINNVSVTSGQQITFKNPKLLKVAADLYLIGNEDSAITKVMRLNTTNNQWELQNTCNGYSNSAVNVDNKILIGGTAGIKIYDIGTKSISNTSFTSTMRGMVTSDESNLLFVAISMTQGSIVDKQTLTQVAQLPSDVVEIYSASITNNKLYLTYVPLFGPTLFKEYSNGTWITLAELDYGFTGIERVRYDVQADKLYCQNSSGKINGNPVGPLVYYKDGQWFDAIERNNAQGIGVTNFTITNTGDLYVISGPQIWTSKTGTTTGIKNNIAKSNIKLYPNPTTERITITSPDTRTAILYALNGDIINTYDLRKSEETIIDVSNLSNGVYIIDNTKFTIQR